MIQEERIKELRELNAGLLVSCEALLSLHREHTSDREFWDAIEAAESVIARAKKLNEKNTRIQDC